MPVFDFKDTPDPQRDPECTYEFFIPIRLRLPLSIQF